jgi:serine kinase of HPr protein (carbohydrate metabolism regulator)
MMRVHGTAVAIEGKGVLIQGPSGSGKSDLALRLIDGGARLIADDQTELHQAPGGGVVMRAPSTIAGKIEVRGVGVLPVPNLAEAPLRLVVALAPATQVERLPEPRFVEYFQQSVPILTIAPFEASAAAKIRLALAVL